jgi:5-methylcytosine-specific restriction endonuclease McrA
VGLGVIGTATQKPKPRVLVQAEKRRQKIKTLREASAEVKKRDGGKCRVCGTPGNQAHHLVYRSHGGKDTPSNLVWCCSTCHRLIHAKVLLVTFKPDNPAATVKFSRNTAWD